jgi:dihydroorotase
MRILIKDGRVVDPANKIDGVKDVLIKDSKIARITSSIKEKPDKIIDAKEKIVMPGIVDMHVHLREPGREDKETVESATLAALKGGVTSVLAMPNTQPAMDSADNIRLLKSIIKNSAKANVFISGTITKGRLGQDLADIKALKKEGVIAITDDGSSVDNKELFLRALQEAKKEGLLVIAHCEDSVLSARGVINLGLIATILGLRGIPREAEYKRVARDLDLARQADASIHIAHVSCKESVTEIAKAKKRGIRVTAETAPHYFSLTDEACLDYDTNTKVNPPLRTKEDVLAIKKGLRDGTIDCIATDHAPHAVSDKELEFDAASFGMIGLETALALSITELIDSRILNWPQLVERFSLNPSEILGIDRGTLSVGAQADLIIVDPAREWAVREEDFVSKSKNSPFIGRKLKGKVLYTVVSGKIAYQDNV